MNKLNKIKNNVQYKMNTISNQKKVNQNKNKEMKKSSKKTDKRDTVWYFLIIDCKAWKGKRSI